MRERSAAVAVSGRASAAAVPSARHPVIRDVMSASVREVDAHQLARAIKDRLQHVLIIDSRSFIEHNACHIATAVNVCCSKIVKRRLQHDKLSVKDLLMHACHCNVDEKLDVVVYDQSSADGDHLPPESFTFILLKKLQPCFHNVNLLAGGFDSFHQHYPGLCEDKTRKCPPLTSMSQPCLPITNQGPTKILPFLYLGSQFDAMDKELLKDHNITYELNVSTSCPQPEFVTEGHFMRIPVNDTYNEKLLPYFPEAFNFLDKVREGSGCVLVHCLAGISRSPTVAIAYVMRYLHLSSDDGYRYVKSKRPTISPNFNFLGQLLEYEKQLRRERVLECKPEPSSAPPLCSQKRVCRTDMRTSKLSLDIHPSELTNVFLQPRSGDQSPTTALAKLSFDGQKAPDPPAAEGRLFRSKSCYADCFRDREDAFLKSKECHLAAAKVLSPVREIKCDGLISEISTGAGAESLSTARQRLRSSYHGAEGKPVNVFAQFASEKRTTRSHTTEERFSIQTLSHQTISFNAKVQEFSNAKAPQKSGESNPWDGKRKGNRAVPEDLPSANENRVSPFMAARSGTVHPKKETTQSSFVFHESAFQSKASSHHPFSFNIASYNRSDSGGTSGRGSEGSDSTDPTSELSKKPGQFRLDIDLEQLDDSVIPRNRDQSSTPSRKHGASDPPFFPVPLSNMASDWVPLRSPLSPSESHLLEDLEMEKDLSKTEPSSPIGSGNFCDDVESCHDSGVPISPPWVWPRKRVANFDAGLSAGHSPPARDKRKYQPLSQADTRTASCALYASAYQPCDSGDKMGLYRVQSCPGILSHVSAFCFDPSTVPLDRVLRAEMHERTAHESCPDALHLAGSAEVRQRELRRNVRCIRVA